MRIKDILFPLLISLCLSQPIEFQIYKSPEAYDELKKSDAMLDDIEKTHFMTNLKIGNNIVPLQVEMATEDVLINDNVLPNVKSEDNKKTEKLLVAEKDMKLEFKNTEKTGEPLNKEASGILGLSLGDLEEKNENKFVDQLVKNKLTGNKAFYFEFESLKADAKCKVPTLADYLGIKGKVIIGDFPYNISPEKYSKDNAKTAPILQVIKNKDYPMYDDSSYAITMNMEKCVGCTGCARACANIAGQNVLECERKGKAHTASGKKLADTNCISCGQCTLACPMKSITEKFDKDELTKTLKNKEGKIVVCQFAPAVRINMAEALGVPVGEISTGKIVTALKKLGFDYIFDTNFAADMTIVEEATELIHRLNDPEAVLPMFTSCCPAWVNYIEKSRPDLIPHLSSCKSPLSMLSSVIKNIFPKKIGVERERIYNVAIMPCTAKKDEIKRPQLTNDTDIVVTSRELAQMIKDAKIDFKNLEESKLDSIYSEFTGGGAIFCATGGVMEAAVRSAYKFITGKDMVPMVLKDVRGVKEGIKKASVNINGIVVNVAVAHGIKNAMTLLAYIKDKEPGFENIHFIEVMACPGGCVMGGGSPKGKGKKATDLRINATYSIDDKSKKRVPQDNEQLNKLYEESFEGEYGSHTAHKLLHTYYTNRKVDKTWGINLKQVNFNHTSVSSYSTQSLLKIENNFIVAPHSFIPVLHREFLNLADVRDKCKVHISSKYKFVLCDKDLDVDKFPKLEFYSDDLDHTFVMEGRDLFVLDEKNNHLLLLIVFDLFTPIESHWELGLPFFKKQSMYFDMEKENVGVFHEDVSQPKGNSLFKMITISAIFFLCALVFVLTYVVCSKSERKKRANELEEDFEYVKS